MAIPNKQIGWSNEANLLWYIAKELEQIKGQLNRLPAGPTTTTTTTLGVITMSYAPFGDPVYTACTNPLGSMPITYAEGVTSFCDANVIYGDFSSLEAYGQIVGSVNGFTSQWNIVSPTQANRSSSCGSC